MIFQFMLVDIEMKKITFNIYFINQYYFLKFSFRRNKYIIINHKIKRDERQSQQSLNVKPPQLIKIIINIMIITISAISICIRKFRQNMVLRNSLPFRLKALL